MILFPLLLAFQQPVPIVLADLIGYENQAGNFRVGSFCSDVMVFSNCPVVGRLQSLVCITNSEIQLAVQQLDQLSICLKT